MVYIYIIHNFAIHPNPSTMQYSSSQQVQNQIDQLEKKKAVMQPDPTTGKYDRGYYAVTGMIKNLKIKLARAFTNENLAR